MTPAPRHQMEHSLMGRQHTDTAHRLSYKPYVSWWRFTRPQRRDALLFTAIASAALWMFIEAVGS